MNEQELFKLCEKMPIFPLNSEFKRYFMFFSTVLFVRGTFWYSDSGIIAEKSNFSAKKAICLVKQNYCRKKG